MAVVSLAGNIWDDHPPLETPFDWWACEHPEKPPDGGCAFWHHCAACRLALAVCATNPSVQASSHVRVVGDHAIGNLSPGEHSLLDTARAVAYAQRDEAMRWILDRAGA